MHVSPPSSGGEPRSDRKSSTLGSLHPPSRNVPCCTGIACIAPATRVVLFHARIASIIWRGAAIRSEILDSWLTPPAFSECTLLHRYCLPRASNARSVIPCTYRLHHLAGSRDPIGNPRLLAHSTRLLGMYLAAPVLLASRQQRA